ncbi:MAG TPA: hypothetical protein VFR90_15525 [Methylibium sp.]|nr:hypothetical protein [Methylibium sp.]
MKTLTKKSLAMLAVGAGLAFAHHAHADYPRAGIHLLYVDVGSASPYSILVHNNRDHGRRCYNLVGRQDIKTNFSVNKDYWFSISYYGRRDCAGREYAKRWWLPTSDNNKYWYAKLD